jgi:hypothetical protein
MTGTTELAKSLKLVPHRLRRELLFLELMGLAQFKRVGPTRIIAPEQMPLVLGWLRKRGLISETVLVPS